MRKRERRTRRRRRGDFQSTYSLLKTIVHTHPAHECKTFEIDTRIAAALTASAVSSSVDESISTALCDLFLWVPRSCVLILKCHTLFQDETAFLSLIREFANEEEKVAVIFFVCLNCIWKTSLK